MRELNSIKAVIVGSSLVGSYCGRGTACAMGGDGSLWIGSSEDGGDTETKASTVKATHRSLPISVSYANDLSRLRLNWYEYFFFLLQL